MLSRSEDLAWKAKRCLQSLDSEEKLFTCETLSTRPISEANYMGESKCQTKTVSSVLATQNLCEMLSHLGDPRYEKTVVPFLANKEIHGKMRVLFSGFEIGSNCYQKWFVLTCSRCCDELPKTNTTIALQAVWFAGTRKVWSSSPIVSE